MKFKIISILRLCYDISLISLNLAFLLLYVLSSYYPATDIKVYDRIGYAGIGLVCATVFFEFLETMSDMIGDFYEFVCKNCFKKKK